LLGNGDGTFRPATSYPSGGLNALSVAAADFNGDGHIDLAVANLCSSSSCANGEVGVLLGTGDGTFQAARSYASGGSQTNFLAVGDFNGDGKPDLATAINYASGGNSANGGVAGILIGNGDGTFQHKEFRMRSGGTSG